MLLIILAPRVWSVFTRVKARDIEGRPLIGGRFCLSSAVVEVGKWRIRGGETASVFHVLLREAGGLDPGACLAQGWLHT